MDALDLKILKLLQEDASITNAKLAERVSLSPSSCLRRVNHLKKSGKIVSIVAMCDPAALGRGLALIVLVTLKHDAVVKRRAFIEKVSNEAAISQAYSVAGETDVVLFMNLTGMDEYVDICERIFDHDENVEKFISLFAMDQFKNETAIPLDALE